MTSFEKQNDQNQSIEKKILIKIFLEENQAMKDVDIARKQAQEHFQMIQKQEYVLREKITGKLNQLQKTLFRNASKVLSVKPINNTIKKQELNNINNSINVTLSNSQQIKNINLQSIQRKIISLYNKSAMTLANTDRDKRKMQFLEEKSENNCSKIKEIKFQIQKKREQLSKIYAMRSIQQKKLERMAKMFSRMI